MRLNTRSIDLKILSCDVETTGLNPCQNDWIEGSFAVLDEKTLEVEKEILLQSRPDKWYQEAFETHKIRKAVAMKFPSREETLQKLVDFIPKEPFYFLCHSKPHGQSGQYFHFDYAFLKMDFTYRRSIFDFWKYFNDDLNISTHTIALELRKQGHNIPKELKLDVLCDHFGIQFNHHNAKSDRIAMEKLLRILRDNERHRTGFI